MKERFEGPNGRKLLIASLRSQRIVEYDENLAKLLAEKGLLEEFQPGDALTQQGDATNDVYFVLLGEVDVFVNERHIATRLAHECIGEMAIVDPAAPRSATVKAKIPTAALKLSAADFQDAVDSTPRAWRAIARILADRLRQRESSHRAPNQQPVLFIGCSTESLSIARELQAILKFDKVTVRLWTDGVFGPSGVAIDELLELLHAADFAAFIVSADDKVTSRTVPYDAPRDNVVLELGLALGELGRSRTFLIKEDKADVKIPTDLLGIKPVTYIRNDGEEWSTILGPTCTELLRTIKKIGAR